MEASSQALLPSRGGCYADGVVRDEHAALQMEMSLVFDLLDDFVLDDHLSVGPKEWSQPEG